MEQCDVLLCGTGSFAARIAFDLAATTRDYMHVTIAGRNVARLDWLVTASNARAKIFNCPIRFSGYAIDLLAAGGAVRMIEEIQSPLVVQAASAQTSSVIVENDNLWSRFVREGGLSATALAQTAVSLRVAEAITAFSYGGQLINCSFPDVVNEIIVAAGHDVLCGFGNVGILSNVFAAALDLSPLRIKVLSHYQNLAAFRLEAAARRGLTARVWIDGDEIIDVFSHFSNVKLTPEPVIDISGATGVPVIQALVGGYEWVGHLPGPGGRPGGYPVRVKDKKIVLDLPGMMSEQEAIDWNRSFEAVNGLIVKPDGFIQFTGHLSELLKNENARIANGFHVSEFNRAFSEMQSIRARLEEII